MCFMAVSGLRGAYASRAARTSDQETETICLLKVCFALGPPFRARLEISAAADTAWFSPEFVQGVAGVDGVRRVAAQRTRSLLLDPSLPPVALLARQIEDAAQTLPLVGTLHAAPAGQIPVYVSEAMVDLYGARPGAVFTPLSTAFPSGGSATFFVASVWRDYIRQSGTVAMDRRDYERLTGDRRANELHLWLAPGASAGHVEQTIRDLARGQFLALGPALSRRQVGARRTVRARHRPSDRRRPAARRLPRPGVAP